MPSESGKQHRAMEAAAHGHSTLGIPTKVGKEFVAADKEKAQHKASGGEIYKPDLEKARIVKEHADHFEVMDGDHHYKVAKAPLAHRTVERLRAYAHGGVVKGYADGGAVSSPLEDAQAGSALEGGPASSLTPKEISAFAVEHGLPIPTAAPQTENGLTPAGQLPPDAAAQLAQFRRPLVAQPGAPIQLSATPPLAGEQPAPAPTQQPQPMPQTPGVPSTGATSAIHSGEALQEQGVRSAAAAESKGLAEQAQTQAKAAADFEAQRAQDAATLQQRMQRQEGLFNDLLNSKIDPNRFWHSMSTGQRIGAGIALALGGIGAGLTRGPNYALELINNAINRDMESQKIDIAKRSSALSTYMQQTRDLMTAQHLTRADLLTAAAAKVQAQAAAMGSQKAMAVADQTVGQLKQQAAIELQNATMREGQIRMQPLQMESARLGLEQQQMDVGMRRLQMSAIQALTSGSTTPGARGVHIDPRVISFLPDTFQQRMVALPDGSYALARTPKAADDVNKAQAASAGLRDKLNRYQALLAEHNTPLGTFETKDPADYNTAKALRSSIITDINGLAGLNRFTEQEAELFSQRVPDITKLGRASGKRAALSELGKEIDDRVWNANQQYLNVARRGRPGG